MTKMKKNCKRRGEKGRKRMEIKKSNKGKNILPARSTVQRANYALLSSGNIHTGSRPWAVAWGIPFSSRESVRRRSRRFHLEQINWTPEIKKLLN